MLVLVSLCTVLVYVLEQIRMTGFSVTTITTGSLLASWKSRSPDAGIQARSGHGAPRTWGGTYNGDSTLGRCHDNLAVFVGRVKTKRIRQGS